MKIYLPSAAHTLAEELAREQITPEKSKSIYLNTLAIYAVELYLQTLDIATNFSEGDWRNPLWRSLLDTADLVIPHVGKIECRPILSTDANMSTPGTSEEVVGYMAVQFSESLESVELVGFAAAAIVNGNHQIALTSLQPIEDVLDQLTPVVRLWQWVKGMADSSWQVVDSLIEDAATQIRDLAAEPEMAFRFRQRTDDDSMRRFREITVSHDRLRLIIERIPQENTTKIQIVVKVCPLSDTALIPPDLQLIVSAGETTLKPVGRDVGNFIEKRFTGEPGERFNLRVVQGDAAFMESYEI